MKSGSGAGQDVYPGLMERLEKEGAAVLSDGRFRLTDYGMDVSNYVMAEIFAIIEEYWNFLP